MRKYLGRRVTYCLSCEETWQDTRGINRFRSQVNSTVHSRDIKLPLWNRDGIITQQGRKGHREAEKHGLGGNEPNLKGIIVYIRREMS